MSEEQATPGTEATPPAGLHFDDAQAAADRENLQKSLAPPPRKLGAAMAVAPIGGQLISSVGGIVGFCPIGGIGGPTTPTQIPEFTSPNPPALTQTNYIDCTRWQADLTPAVDDVTQTTSWAQAISLTLPQGRVRVEIINDQRITPAMLARYGLVNPALAAQASFNLGCRMTLIHGNPANYPALSSLEGGAQRAPDFYYCPSVKLLNPNTVIDAIGKKMLRSLPMELACNAPVFHMPYEAANLAAYLAHLTACYQGF